MKKAICCLLLMVLVFPFATGCEGFGKKYTEEEHVKRISERINSRFFNEDAEYKNVYISYTVQMLYNYKDEPIYFLVEFEPDGYVYGFIHNNNYYTRRFCTGTEWPKSYKYPIHGPYEYWYNESLNSQTQYKSHVYISGITDEKIYMGFIGGRGEPAIKRDEFFFHIITGEAAKINFNNPKPTINGETWKL